MRDRFIVQNAANIGGVDGNAEERYAKALSLVTEICVKTQDKVASMEAAAHENIERTKRIEDGINTLLLAQGVKSPCRPSKKPRTTEGSSETTDATPGVASRNAYQAMSTGVAVQNNVSFRNAGAWALNTFVSNVIKSRQVSTNSGFCGDIKSSTRKRYRYVLDGLVALAEDDEKPYFNPNRAPVWDAHHTQVGVDRDLWFRKLDEVVIRLTKELVEKYLKKKARLQAEQDCSDEQLSKRFIKLKNSQKVSLGSVGNLIESVRTNEKKGSWPSKK